MATPAARPLPLAEAQRAHWQEHRPQSMAKIFISYAREDRSKIQRLAKVFEDRGWLTWWDTLLRAGDVWDEVIDRELKAASCVVVLWSRISVNKSWVRVEAYDGMQRGILIPVFIDNVQPPLAFRMIQAESMVDWSGEVSDAGLVRLLAVIDDRINNQRERWDNDTSIDVGKIANPRNRRGVVAETGFTSFPPEPLAASCTED